MSFTNDHPPAETLSALHDGPTVSPAVAEHISNCGDCSLEMRRLAAMSGLLANNFAQIPPLSQISRARLHQQIDTMLANAMENATDSSLIRFGLRISGIAASVLLAGSIWLMVGNTQNGSITQAAPPWVGVAVSSDADAVVRNAATPAAAIYLADASSSDGSSVGSN